MVIEFIVGMGNQDIRCIDGSCSFTLIFQDKLGPQTIACSICGSEQKFHGFPYNPFDGKTLQEQIADGREHLNRILSDRNIKRALLEREHAIHKNNRDELFSKK